MRIQAIVDEAQEIYRRRCDLYQSYEDMLNRYKSTKSASQFTSERKRLEMEHKNLNHNLAQIQGKFGDLYADGVEKVRVCSHCFLLRIICTYCHFDLVPSFFLMDFVHWIFYTDSLNLTARHFLLHNVRKGETSWSTYILWKELEKHSRNNQLVDVFYGGRD